MLEEMLTILRRELSTHQSDELIDIHAQVCIKFDILLSPWKLCPSEA